MREREKEREGFKKLTTPRSLSDFQMSMSDVQASGDPAVPFLGIPQGK